MFDNKMLFDEFDKALVIGEKLAKRVSPLRNGLSVLSEKVVINFFNNLEELGNGPFDWPLPLELQIKYFQIFIHQVTDLFLLFGLSLNLCVYFNYLLFRWDHSILQVGGPTHTFITFNPASLFLHQVIFFHILSIFCALNPDQFFILIFHF